MFIERLSFPGFIVKVCFNNQFMGQSHSIRKCSVLIPPGHVNSLMGHDKLIFLGSPLKRRGNSGREHMFWATKESGVCNSMKTSVQVMTECYSQLHFIVLTTMTTKFCQKWVRLKHKFENSLVFSNLLNFQPCTTLFRAYFPKINTATDWMGMTSQTFSSTFICVYHEAELVLQLTYLRIIA